MAYRRLLCAAALAALILTGGAAPPQSAPAPADRPQMVAIPAGRFVMGSSQAQTDKELTQTYLLESEADNFGAWEKPQHEVQVRAFELGKYPVTRGDFLRFVNSSGYAAVGCYAYNGENYGMSAVADWRNPGFKQTNKHPVLCVSYQDAQAYIRWLNKRTGLSYRLPSEAEMEYATRAGTTTSRFWGEDVARQCEYANGPDLTMKDQFPGWYGAPCRDGYLLTSPVDAFKPNPWGLHDMVGNVFQITEDCWRANFQGAPTDGSAWTGGDCSKRTLRGGSTTSHPGSMTSASRTGTPVTNRTVYVGFRLARSLP